MLKEVSSIQIEGLRVFTEVFVLRAAVTNLHPFQ